jgi:anti-sigma factor ChrR (cupin superfamily)
VNTITRADINADFSQDVVVRTAAMAWQPSPTPGVMRKRLELIGEAESGRVTSVVRYAANSSFPSHAHPDGEEILVLSGTFSDEHGDYPAGTFVLNPDGFSHAPYSREGCDLLVKLRQYPGADRRQVVIDTNRPEWRPGRAPGVTTIPLYAEPGHPEDIRLVHIDPGAMVPEHDHPGGEEVYVIDGDIEDHTGAYETGCWLRHPRGSHHTVHSKAGATLYVKTGHIAA